MKASGDLAWGSSRVFPLSSRYSCGSARGDVVVEVPLKAILFDALLADSPSEMFGSCLEGDLVTLATQDLLAMATQARSQIGAVFGVHLRDGRECVDSIDRIIADMWDTGWSPENGDTNLFCRDFGSVFATTLLEVPNAVPVFRSRSVLDHMSVWLPNNAIEVFPFHKTLKCLWDRDVEKMGQLFRAVVLAASAGSNHTINRSRR